MVKRSGEASVKIARTAHARFFVSICQSEPDILYYVGGAITRKRAFLNSFLIVPLACLGSREAVEL